MRAYAAILRAPHMRPLFLSMLLTVLLTDIAKAYLAGRLSTLITPERMFWMNVIVGIALAVYGVRLFLTGLHLI